MPDPTSTKRASHASASSSVSANRSSVTAKRASAVFPRPASLVIDPSVLIAQHAVLTGSHPMTIGSNVVLHPHSKLYSTRGPVVLDEGVVVYERAQIGTLNPSSATSGHGIMLGRNVVIETGAIIEAAEIGEGTSVEVRARLGPGTVIGKFCTITADVTVAPGTQIPDFTVVYSGSERRVDYIMKSRLDLQQSKMAQHRKQIDVFRRLIPNNAAKWA